MGKGTRARRGRKGSGRTARTPRRRGEAVRRRTAVALSLTVLLVLLISASLPSASAQGITVTNVPPQFSAIDVRMEDGLNYIDVVVSDYNSWSDVYLVQINVLNSARVPVAAVAFQQYPTNTSTEARPAFVQPVGDYLVQELSTASHANRTVTIPDRTDLRLTFVLSPVKGEWVNVSATDLGGLIAYAQVQYQSGYVGGLPLVGEGVLVAVAAVFAVVYVARRIRRDHDEP